MHFQNCNLDTYPFKEFIELFERFPGKVYPWVGNFTEAPTGEEYWIVTQNGFNPNPEEQTSFNSYELCFKYYKRYILALFETSMGGTIYFRTFPSPSYLSHRDIGAVEYTIYSRFLISSKPMIQFADMSHISDQERFKPLGKEE